MNEHSHYNHYYIVSSFFGSVDIQHPLNCMIARDDDFIIIKLGSYQMVIMLPIIYFQSYIFAI
jgi:hypothetical protein